MSDRFEEGLAVRREVLGAEHVDRSLEQASPFSRPMQELVTEYCWGAVWTRQGLDRRTRSLVNLGMLTALDRPHELGAHVRGALNERLHRGGDPGGAAAGGRLLRHAGRAARRSGSPSRRSRMGAGEGSAPSDRAGPAQRHERPLAGAARGRPRNSSHGSRSSRTCRGAFGHARAEGEGARSASR